MRRGTSANRRVKQWVSEQQATCTAACCWKLKLNLSRQRNDGQEVGEAMAGMGMEYESDSTFRRSPIQAVKRLNVQLEESARAEGWLEIERRRLELLNSDHFRQEQEINRLSLQCQRQERDVEGLQRLSLGSLWYRLIGRLDEQLKLKEQQLSVSLLKLQEERERWLEWRRSWTTPQPMTLAGMRTELDDTAAKVEQLQARVHELPELKLQKEELVRKHMPEERERLNALDAVIAQKQRARAELAEAEEACQRMNSCMSEAVSKLESAADWGTYDMLGGGVIATGIKHNRIDEAQEALSAARVAAQSLSEELRDLGEEAAYVIPVSDLAPTGRLFAGRLLHGLACAEQDQAVSPAKSGAAGGDHSSIPSAECRSRGLRRGAGAAPAERERIIIEAVLTA